MDEWMFRSPKVVTIDSHLSSNLGSVPCIPEDGRLCDEFDGTSGIASSLCEGDRDFASEYARSWKRVQSDSGAGIIEDEIVDTFNDCGKDSLFVNLM